MFTRIKFVSLLVGLVLLTVSSAQYDESDDEFEDDLNDEGEGDDIDSLLSKLEEKYASRKKPRQEAKKTPKSVVKIIEPQKMDKKLSAIQLNCKRWHLC